MKKNVLFIGISVSLLILLGIGVSYSMWNISNTQDTENVISVSDCFDIAITSQENSISLKNSYPISDEKGKSLTPFTFKVTNKCETAAKYSINLESLNGSTLSSEFLDVMLNNGEVKRLSSYSSTDKVNSSSVESRELEIGILGNKESRDYSLRLWIDYDTTMEDLDNETKSLKAKIVIIGKPINYTGDTVFNFDYTGGEQVFTVPVSGTYKLETWGAEGGTYDESKHGGLGGYTSGIIKLSNAKNLYIYVGGQSKNKIGGYNGGAAGGSGEDGSYSGGGGATDIRLVNGKWNDFNSLKSRIMVAGAGAGTGNYCNKLIVGGNSGGLIAYDGQKATCGYNWIEREVATGGSNIFGGIGKSANGYFGYSKIAENEYGTGGGSGYYGGGSGDSTPNYVDSGGGGSSFISGHNGCDAIKEESTEDNIIHTGQSIHYSGYYFIDTLMIDGEGYKWTDKKEDYVGMPSHSDNTTMTGNTGNGYARITLVSIDE